MTESEQGGPVLRRVIGFYTFSMREALSFPSVAGVAILVIALAGIWIFRGLDTDFLPPMDEGAFVIDYYSRPGTSLTETNRMLMHVEQILTQVPEVSSFSRRTGARLALAIAEPNTGDFLVKLKQDRNRSTSEVIDDVRERLTAAEPALSFEFPGVLSDLIGDLTWSPNPVEIKVYSNDQNVLKREATEVAKTIKNIPGVVDVNDGLVVAGPSMRIRTNVFRAARAGITPRGLAADIQASILGTVSSYVLQGDRLYDVRVVAPASTHNSQQELESLPVRSDTGAELTLQDVAQIEREPGCLNCTARTCDNWLPCRHASPASTSAMASTRSSATWPTTPTSRPTRTSSMADCINNNSGRSAI